MTQFFKTSAAIAELQKEFPSTNVKELRAWLPYLKHGVDYVDKRLPNNRKGRYEWNVQAIIEKWKLLPEQRSAKKGR
jgi:hypothetical protein